MGNKKWLAEPNGLSDPRSDGGGMLSHSAVESRIISHYSTFPPATSGSHTKK